MHAAVRIARSGALWIVALLVAASPAAGDVFVLKDGRRIEGTLVKEEAGVLIVKTGVGELRFARADVVEVVSKKTPAEEFDARFKAATSAEDFFQAGEYAQSKKLKREATKAWNRAIELDPDHVGARGRLGFVLYKGAWLTPQERDARARADEDAEMAARGLVRHGDAWVTVEDKAKLDAGLVLFEGKWIPFADAQRKLGLELYEGTWIPRPAALARNDFAAVVAIAGPQLGASFTDDAMIAGPYPLEFLQSIGESTRTTRAWFDQAWRSPPGLALFGGRMAELYAFGRDPAPFTQTVPHFAAMTTTVPPGWAEAVAKSHGYFFIDPFPLSSARQWQRGEVDIAGHCLHHWGHLLVGRLGYDGRLLPAWYEEAVACLTEARGHARNAVFCRGTLIATTGTSAGRTQVAFDPARFREGGWKEFLRAAFEQKLVPGFDRLAQQEFASLELVDIAAGMAIVEWLSTQKEGAGLRLFHDEVRRGAPKSPQRVIPDSFPRQAHYDRAFQAAAGLNWRDADQAWRRWFLAGG